jgi:hypothetical protein
LQTKKTISVNIVSPVTSRRTVSVTARDVGWRVKIYRGYDNTNAL